jgi:hypothetical protein
MSRGSRHDLRAEGGQSLVFVILLMFSLVAVLGLVVDVGAWIGVQRQAQTVADSAALAAAQELPDVDAAEAAARDYAQRNNWPLADVDSNVLSGSSTIQVVVEKHDVPGLFSRIVGFAGVDRISAESAASVLGATTVKNAAPLALECDPCDPSALLDGNTHTFWFRDTAPWSPGALRGFGPLEFNSSMDTDDFEDYLLCNPQSPSGNCYGNDFTVPDNNVDMLDTDDDNDNRPDELFNALNPVEGDPWPRLVAIYDDYDSTPPDFDLVGWAAFRITDVWRSSGGRRVRLRGVFESLVAAASADSSSDAINFGVQAVALTK